TNRHFSTQAVIASLRSNLSVSPVLGQNITPYHSSQGTIGGIFLLFLEIIVYSKYSFIFSKKLFSLFPGCGLKLADERNSSNFSRSSLETAFGVQTFT